MGYTVISRDPNNWVHTPEGRDFHEITYACGHNHRTMEGAIRCLDSLAGTTDSLHAEIEEKHIDQMYAGEKVDLRKVYYYREEMVSQGYRRKGAA